MATAQNQEQHYKIKDAIITSDRFPGEEFEITQQIVELTVYESLEKPYLTGQIAVLDDKGLFNQLKFKGTEKLSIQIASAVPGVDDVHFQTDFIMTSIEKIAPAGDRSEMFIFTLLDVHAYFDAAKRISKSYSGKLEDIIIAIITSEIGLDVDASYFAEASIQPPVKVIVPYLSPINACLWLSDRLTTKLGEPWFVWSTMYDLQSGEQQENNRIRIGDLGTMLSQTPFNIDSPFYYSTATAATIEDAPPEARFFMVKGFTKDKTENTMRMVAAGAVGSNVTSQDVFTNRKYQGHFKLRDLLKRIITSSEETQNVFDEEQIFAEDGENTEYMDDADSRFFHTLTSFGTYNRYNSLHDVYDLAESKNKIRSNAVRNLLHRNMYEITIDGPYISGTGVSVGDLISLVFLNQDYTGGSEGGEEEKDLERSGNYLLYGIRHIFSDGIHTVAAKVTKLTAKETKPK